MKNITIGLIILIKLLPGVNINAQQYKVQPAFVLRDSLAVIEGMAYDPVYSNFYFGENVGLKILKYTKSGRPAGYIDAAEYGMASILGMTVSAATHHLWVCGSTILNGKKMMCLFQYNLKDGKLVNQFPDTSAKAGLFNDITITADGSIYATDTYTRSLYKADMVSKTAILYLQTEALKNANGITADGNILYVSTSNGFARVNTADKKITLANHERYMIAGNDGLYYYNHSLIGIQNVFFPFTIGRYFLSTDETKIARAAILTSEHPSFNIPATGAFVKDEFYFMANTNLLYFDFDKNKLISPGKIKKIRIMKISMGKQDGKIDITTEAQSN